MPLAGSDEVGQVGRSPACVWEEVVAVRRRLPTSDERAHLALMTSPGHASLRLCAIESTLWVTSGHRRARPVHDEQHGQDRGCTNDDGVLTSELSEVVYRCEDSLCIHRAHRQVAVGLAPMDTVPVAVAVKWNVPWP